LRAGVIVGRDVEKVREITTPANFFGAFIAPEW
jgi:hypothetical protein